MTKENSTPTVEKIQELVQEVARTLGIDSPKPLFEYGQKPRSDREWHLIGLIGGKEVGKSALVNSLVGRSISESTSYGPGTEKVVAYVHKSQSESVEQFLQSEAPDRYEIVEHAQDGLNRQVLLDLPDIDSHYSSHFETVRKLLRFILFPIWIQSVEKYADRQPMDLLRKVVQGNAPENFLYCLNKADQLEHLAGESAVSELAQDYGERISNSLDLNQPPPVYMISAVLPEKYDLPRLKKILSHQKGEQEVTASRNLAARQYGTSLLAWISEQGLSSRVERLERIEEHLAGLLHRRIETPISEEVLPTIQQDPRVEGFLFAETFRSRIQRWPIVRLLDSLSSPAMKWLHFGTGEGSDAAQNLSKGVAEGAFNGLEPTPVLSLQASFANSRSSFPQLGPIYENHPLWEEREAKICVGDLKKRLRESHEAFMAQARATLEPSTHPVGGFLRLFLVFGALIWFPFGQPVLQRYLEEGSLTELPLLVVSLLGVGYLLSSALFLFLFFAFIWLGVRWKAQHSVQKVLKSLMKKEAGSDRSLEGAARDWGLTLLQPLEEEKGQMLRLENEKVRLEQELASPH